MNKKQHSWCLQPGLVWVNWPHLSNRISNLLFLKTSVRPSDRKPNLPEISEEFFVVMYPGLHRVFSRNPSTESWWRLMSWSKSSVPILTSQGMKACQDLSLLSPSLLFEHHSLISSGGCGLWRTLTELVFHFNEIIQDFKNAVCHICIFFWLWVGRRWWQFGVKTTSWVD